MHNFNDPSSVNFNGYHTKSFCVDIKVKTQKGIYVQTYFGHPFLGLHLRLHIICTYMYIIFYGPLFAYIYYWSSFEDDILNKIKENQIWLEINNEKYNASNKG